jgi:alpha-1,2-mannosyltransferase
VRRLFVLLGVVFVITGAVNLEVYSRDLIAHQQPVDFELNWVGAHRLVHREPLYDRAASQRDGFELIGPGRFDFSNGATYASYIGSPATALLYVPFVPFEHDPAAALYRVLQVVLMAAAIVVTAWALPRRSRLPAVLVGVGALLWGYPFAESIGLGQVDGFIMLALAIALWASVRDHWRLVGAALGIAALLKISPGLLLVYLVLRGRRTVILPAILSAGTLLGIATVVGRPGDTVKWITDVLPEVSKGGLLVNNQSIPAWVARLFGGNLNWLSLDTDLGAWRFLAFPVMIAGLAAVFYVRRGRAFVPLELGAVILVALLAGPVTWDHYPTWAVLTLVLMADLRWWEGRRAGEIVALLVVLAGGLALMWKKTLYPTADVIRADWTRHLESGTKTVGMLALLAVALWLLARPPEGVAPEGGPDASARRLRSEEAPSGEEGVHARR